LTRIGQLFNPKLLQYHQLPLLLPPPIPDGLSAFGVVLQLEYVPTGNCLKTRPVHDAASRRGSAFVGAIERIATATLATRSNEVFMAIFSQV
jgi:hypothetical protein